MTRFSLLGRGFLNCCRAQSRGDENFSVSRYPTLLLMKEYVPRRTWNEKQAPGTQLATWLSTGSPAVTACLSPCHFLTASGDNGVGRGGGEEMWDSVNISARIEQGGTTLPLHPLFLPDPWGILNWNRRQQPAR